MVLGNGGALPPLRAPTLGSASAPSIEIVVTPETASETTSQSRGRPEAGRTPVLAAVEAAEHLSSVQPLPETTLPESANPPGTVGETVEPTPIQPPPAGEQPRRGHSHKQQTHQRAKPAKKAVVAKEGANGRDGRSDHAHALREKGHKADTNGREADEPSTGEQPGKTSGQAEQGALKSA
jgi:hypothetical protein